MEVTRGHDPGLPEQQMKATSKITSPRRSTGEEEKVELFLGHFRPELAFIGFLGGGFKSETPV